MGVRFGFAGRRNGLPSMLPARLVPLGSDRGHKVGRDRICRGLEQDPWNADGLPPADPVAISRGVPRLSGKGRTVRWSRLLLTYPVVSVTPAE